MRTAQIAMLLLLLLCSRLTGQEREENLLAYLPAQVKQFKLYRPARILRSKTVGELRAIAGPDFEKVTRRLLNQYFKFGLAELKNVDAIVDANWTVMSKTDGRRSRSYYTVLILRTEKDHQNQFDMATHAVKEEIKFEGKTVLHMKVPLDGRYEFACILDSKTIAWSRTIEGIRQTISSGRKGPEKFEFFPAWKAQQEKDIFVFLRAEERDFENLPAPLEDWKGVQWGLAGIKLDKTVKLELHAKFESNQSATRVEEKFDEQLQFIRTILRRRPASVPTEKVVLEIGESLIANARAKRTQDRIRVVTQAKLKLKSLVEPLGAMYAASKRTEAANHLRHHTIGLLNMESALGNFPSSVLTHESGKQYSWRIAILPYLGRQDIYDRYDFTQDWNSPHNLDVTSEMPDFFAAIPTTQIRQTLHFSC